METALVMGGAILWALLAVLAVGASLFAFIAKAKKRSVATFAMCLWSAVAGGTLTSALWAWMTTMNWNYQQFQIAKLPANTKLNDVELQNMSMLILYVKLDALGRRFLYAMVVMPLIFSIVFFWKSRNQLVPKKPTLAGDEYFSAKR